MSNTESTRVAPVSGSKDWRDFFGFKHTLYRDDPAYVRPLRSMERQQLDVDVHPFYDHATREAFLARRGGKIVGRVAAIKDDLHNEYYDDTVGFFGFFESIDDQDVARALIKTAGDWLKARGCDRIRGPVNPSMKSDFGILIEGNDVPPYIMMGHSPKHYDRLLQDSGLEVCKSFLTFIFEPDENDKSMTDRLGALAEIQPRINERFPQLSLRAVGDKNFDRTMRDINELGNQVRAENFGFVPLTVEELDFMIKQMRRIIRFDMIHAAYWGDKLVGFIVNLPDLNWALSKTIGGPDWIRMPQLLYWLKRTPRTRVIALGVDKSFRSKGIAMMLIKRLTDLRAQYKTWELSWIVEDNVKSIRAIQRAVPTREEKVYRLYEGPIA